LRSWSIYPFYCFPIYPFANQNFACEDILHPAFYVTAGQPTFPEGKRLKVLSLFFIDRLANYAAEDRKIRRCFEEAYREISASPLSLRLPKTVGLGGGD